MVNQIQGDGGSVGVVSVMSANNELGTMNDIASIAGELRSAASGVPLHTDAVQAAPWLDLSDVVGEADLVSVSSHKLGGPKGTGALVVRRGVELAPLLVGGSQEHGMRAGTTDVAGVVGFAAAFRETVGERAVRSARVAELRDRLADLILDGVDGVVETVGPRVAAGLGLPADRTHLLPGHLHLTVEHANSEELLLLLEAGGVCASAASSCASGAVGASHVLAAIGADRPGAAALRLSLGPELTPDHLDQVFMAIRDAVGRLRAVPGGPKQ
jgi:cysteine desulfurase